MSTRLLSTALLFAVAAFTPTAGFSSAPLSADQIATSVENQLRSVKSVEFYFISRTEDWNYTPDELAAKSTIRAYRACGANCHNFMRPVLNHLRAAQPVNCLSGQENALIRAQPGVELVYSHGGRHIRVAGNCYLSDHSIRKIISGDSMLFSSRRALPDSGTSANNSFKPTLLRKAA